MDQYFFSAIFAMPKFPNYQKLSVTSRKPYSSGVLPGSDIFQHNLGFLQFFIFHFLLLDRILKDHESRFLVEVRI